MLKIVCDRCGRDIPMPGRIGYIALDFKEGMNGSLSGENPFEGKDYCDACMDDVRKFIQAAPQAATEPAGQQEAAEGTGQQEPQGQQEAPAGRRRVDIGKITALRNAGWPIKEIALEMGMEPAAVSNAICRHNKKKGIG